MRHSPSAPDARLVPITSFGSVNVGSRLIAREHARRRGCGPRQQRLRRSPRTMAGGANDEAARTAPRAARGPCRLGARAWTTTATLPLPLTRTLTACERQQHRSLHDRRTATPAMAAAVRWRTWTTTFCPSWSSSPKRTGPTTAVPAAAWVPRSRRCSRTRWTRPRARARAHTPFRTTCLPSSTRPFCSTSASRRTISACPRPGPGRGATPRTWRGRSQARWILPPRPR